MCTLRRVRASRIASQLDCESESASPSESEDGDSSVETLRIHESNESVEEVLFDCEDDLEHEHEHSLYDMESKSMSCRERDERDERDEQWDIENAIILHHANKLLELIPDHQ